MKAGEWVKAHAIALLSGLATALLGLALILAEAFKKPKPVATATPDTGESEHKRADALVKATELAGQRQRLELQAVALTPPTAHESQILTMDEQALADEWNKTHGKR